MPALLLAGIVACTASLASAQQAPTFTQVVVFGDSLSDDGNVRHRSDSDSGAVVGYPGGLFNYSDGRFTNSSDTDPGSAKYVGVWHEQLSRTFLRLSAATNSLDGGTDYAFGGATTIDGTSKRAVVPGGAITFTIDNIGKQVSDYLSNHVADPNALYVVWGGGNDLFDDASDTNVSATSARVAALVNKLVNAGARNVLVPNVPPLGAVPQYAGDETKSFALDKASSDYRFRLNAALDADAQGFTTAGLTVKIFRLDVWELFVRMTGAPSVYGFTNITDGAQGKSSVNPDTYAFWDDIHPTTAGHYQIAVEANRVLSGAVAAPGRNLNVSTRVAVGTGDNVSIAGFIVTGADPKPVVVRGIGPSLAKFNVPGPLLDPMLELHDATGAIIATNDNWKDSQAAAITATGLAPSDDRESAIAMTLAPGSYTAVLAGRNNTSGVGLAEVFDTSTAANSTLANVSTRGFVGTGDNALIGGFIVGAGGSPVVVVRAVGPSLSAKGVTAPLLDPTIELHDQNGAIIASNDNWKDTQESSIKATGLAPSDSREAAILGSLTAGNYTAIVRGKNNTTGTALVEAYTVQ